MDKVKISVSPANIIFFLASIIFILFLYQIKDVILLLFASFVIASALYPSVDWMSRKIPRGLVIAFVYLIGLIIVLTLLIPFITVIFSQFQEFIKKFPGYWEHLIKIAYDLDIIAKSQGFIPDYSQIISNAAKIGQEILNRSIDITINLFSGIVAVFTLAVIVLFLLLDKDVLKKGYIKIFPPKYRETAKHITETISRKVGGYVRGQLLLMFIVGLLTGVGLKIIGIEFALLLGITAGILEIIPIAGPVLASVPAVIIAVAQDPVLVIWVIVLYLVIQRLENHFLTPMILGKFLEMHPLIIIAAILISVNTLGVFGVILSPAIAAAIYVLFQELYLKKLEVSKED